MNTKRSDIKNIAASVGARLLNIAKATERDFNAVLLQYFQERFLYRNRIEYVYSFVEIIGRLENFLKPVCLNNEEKSTHTQWNPKSNTWQEVIKSHR